MSVTRGARPSTIPPNTHTTLFSSISSVMVRAGRRRRVQTFISRFYSVYTPRCSIVCVCVGNCLDNIVHTCILYTSY